MARSGRRSRGRGGSEIRGTLGTLLRTTLAQAGVVRDVLQRGAREGRARLDDVRRERHRDQALADLGQAVLDAVRAGDAPELYDLPEVVAAIDELDRIDRDAEADHDHDLPPEREPDWVPARTRGRFDRRPAEPAREPERRGARERDRGPRDRRGDAGDGTVSSSDWRPPPPSAPGRVWRPPRDERHERDLEHEPGARFAEPRRGGISFGNDAEPDDDDLADYMHPDDVPARDGDGAPASDGDDRDGDAPPDDDSRA